MSTNKTIAKNTIFLYFRMALTMGVALYTSRVVLDTLGVSDYGIYSLVGGFVAMFGFFNGAMAAATLRYLSYDLGLGNAEKLQKTFSATLTVHIGIAVVVFLLLETLGLWYLNNIMVFPRERTYAINLIYQFSIAAALLGIIQVPYNALLIARERMSIYAYVSIVEVLLKLGIVFLLVFFGSDKLITYAILTFIVALFIRLFYQYYCKKNFSESKYTFEYDKVYFKEIISYTGWNSLGSVALLVCSQGNNIILNLFFGTAVNAAFAVALQVQNAILMFVQNFQTAVNPQIIKQYAQKNFTQMETLIFSTAKFSFFLLLLIVVPIFINIDFILKLWLNIVPPHTSNFVRYALVYLLIEILSFSLITGIQATGKVKWFQIVLGFVVFLNLPISYIFLKTGGQPETIFMVLITIAIVSFFCRMMFVKSLLDFEAFKFLKIVVVRVIAVTIIPLFSFYIINNFLGFSLRAQSFVQLLMISAVFISLILLGIYFIGLTREDRYRVINLVHRKKIK